MKRLINTPWFAIFKYPQYNSQPKWVFYFSSLYPHHIFFQISFSWLIFPIFIAFLLLLISEKKNCGWVSCVCVRVYVLVCILILIVVVVVIFLVSWYKMNSSVAKKISCHNNYHYYYYFYYYSLFFFLVALYFHHNISFSVSNVLCIFIHI